MLFRRARPTLRVLREDLTTGWDHPSPRRWLAEGNIPELHPLTDLPHPIVAKAAQSFGEDPSDDTSEGLIASARSLDLHEIKLGQWRGAVWMSEDGACWLVMAALAKGDHEDWNDFYQQVRRLEKQGGLPRLLPEAEDKRLWKREMASQRLSLWELSIQDEVIELLEIIHVGGRHRVSIHHPLEDALDESDRLVAKIDIHIESVRELDYDADEVIVTIHPTQRWTGTSLEWTMITRVLISLNPPEQSWDRYQNTFSNIAEPGTFTTRLASLKSLADAGQLAESQPGTHAHRAHKRGLTERTINGKPVRALCGVHFVPRQDHQVLPECEECSVRMEEIEAL